MCSAIAPRPSGRARPAGRPNRLFLARSEDTYFAEWGYPQPYSPLGQKTYSNRRRRMGVKKFMSGSQPETNTLTGNHGATLSRWAIILVLQENVLPERVSQGGARRNHQFRLKRHIGLDHGHPPSGRRCHGEQMGMQGCKHGQSASGMAGLESQRIPPISNRPGDGTQLSLGKWW